MKLIFLGTGSAFTVGDNNYQSNMIIESDSGKRLLLDCGSDVRFSLNEQNLSYKDIDAVYLSHLHADHVGGLEWLAFTTYFDSSCEKKVDLYIKQNMVGELWHHVLSGGLSSIQKITPSLNTYFNVCPIQGVDTFVWEGVTFQLIQTIHVFSGYSIIPSYGLFFMANGHKIFITTDTQFIPHQLEDYYQKATLIFHDCETADHKSGIHATYDELKTLAPSIKKKTWLYHYHPGPLPDCRKDGFKGFVKKGQIFDFSFPIKSKK